MPNHSNQIEELSINDIDFVDGGIPILLAYAAYGFVCGLTATIAAYAATHQH